MPQAASHFAVTIQIPGALQPTGGATGLLDEALPLRHSLQPSRATYAKARKTFASGATRFPTPRQTAPTFLKTQTIPPAANHPQTLAAAVKSLPSLLVSSLHRRHSCGRSHLCAQLLISAGVSPCRQPLHTLSRSYLRDFCPPTTTYFSTVQSGRAISIQPLEAPVAAQVCPAALGSMLATFAQF